MKKLLAFLTAALIFLSCFALSVSADGAYTFSEDMKTAYLNGNIYYSFDDRYVEVYSAFEYDVRLTEAQKEKYTSVALSGTEDSVVLWGSFIEKDGSVLNVSYLRSDLFVQYKSALKGETDEYCIEHFLSSEYFTVKAEALKRTPTRMTNMDYMKYDYSLDVFVEIGEEKLHINMGEIFYHSGEYYYLDYSEAGFDPFGTWPDEFDVYIVDDPDTVSLLVEANGSGTEFEQAFIDFTDFATAALLLFLFVIIPGGVFIFSFIMTFLSKKRPYKSRYITLTLVSAFEMLLFAAISAIVIFDHII